MTNVKKIADDKTVSSYEELRRIKIIRDNYMYSSSKINSILNHKSDVNLDEYHFYVNAVQETFKELGVVAKQFISNDFFYPANDGWWEKLYSRSTYYRLRGEAIKQFIAIFNEKVCHN